MSEQGCRILRRMFDFDLCPPTPPTTESIQLASRLVSFRHRYYPSHDDCDGNEKTTMLVMIAF